MEVFNNFPSIMMPEDISKYIPMGRNKTYEVLKSGKLKSIRIGKKYIIPKEYLIEFILDQTTSSA